MRRPSCSSMLDLFSPCPSTRTTSGWLVKAAIRAGESAQATTRSRSPTVSFKRRRLPAASARCTPGNSRSQASQRCPAVKALPRDMRDPRAASPAMPARMLVSVFAPMPGSVAIFPALAAASRSARVRRPNSFQNRATFLGPTPETRSKSSREGGTSSSRRLRNSSLPVVSSSWIFSVMALPMPGTLGSSPRASRAAASSGRSRRLSAARW